jgi:hypothetical protein
MRLVFAATLTAVLVAAPRIALAQAASCPVSTFGAGIPASIPPLHNPGIPSLDPRDVAIADFNDDLFTDVAIATADQVVVMLADGEGRFVSGGAVSVPQAIALAAADFNRDGHTDLVISNPGDGTPLVRVFPGNGDGTFASPVLLPLSEDRGVEPLIVGDFTGDGLADIAGIRFNPDSFVTLFRGDGAGGFSDPVDFPIGGTVYDLISGDFNTDGRLDLGAVGGGFETSIPSVRLLFGTAAGGFSEPSILPIGETMKNLVAADFDADGDLDLALGMVRLSDTQYGVTLLRGDGTGAFSPSGIVAVSPYRFGTLAAGDFDGDGLADLAVPNVRLETFADGLTSPVGMIDILYSDGSGGFRNAASFVAGEAIDYLGAAHVNADGRLDLVAVTVPFETHPDPQAVVALLNTCGAAVDAAVTLSQSADLVHALSPLTYTIDVSNLGPDAGPVVLRMMVASDGVNFNSVTTSHGRCRPGPDVGRFTDGVLMCWFGILDPGETAHVILQTTTLGLGTYTSTARVTSGGQDPNSANNVDAAFVRVASLGGYDMRLAFSPGGSVRLTWNAGDYQAAYYIGRYTNSGLTVLPANGIPLPRDATSFTDDTPVQGELNCYVVTPVDASGTAIGRSDMLCVKPGSASGQAPSDFSIALNQGFGSQLKWSGPGGQTGYLLIAHPLNGQPESRIPLQGTATKYIHAATPACYVLIPGNGTTALGASDLFCAYPGVSSLDP